MNIRGSGFVRGLSRYRTPANIRRATDLSRVERGPCDNPSPYFNSDRDIPVFCYIAVTALMDQIVIPQWLRGRRILVEGNRSPDCE